MSKRKIKKAILAEALRIHRANTFNVRSFDIDVTTGRIVFHRLAEPYEFMTNLIHLCGQLEGPKG